MGPGRRRQPVVAALAAWIVVGFGFVGPAAATAPESTIDNQDAVELLDAGLRAYADGDGDTLDGLLDIAEDLEVWLPVDALVAFLNGDVGDVAFYRDLLANRDADLFDEAAGLVEDEFNALLVLTDNPGPTSDQSGDLASADADGATVLEIIDYRGLTVSPTARTVLETLPTEVGALAPADDDYFQAIDELVTLAGVAATSDSVDATPVETAPVDAAPVEAAPVEAAPVATAPTEAAPTEAAPTEAAPTEAAPTEARSTPEATPTTTTPADDSTLLLVLAAIALAGLAFVGTMFTAVRGRRHDKLADVAFTDGLTGLKNRRRLDADVDERTNQARPTAALMVDVDHFKKFNDTHGHAMGDEVLRLVGQTLSREFRRNDVPYRYGGEEFCVLLPDTTEAEAMAAGERLRVAIAAIDLPIDEQVTASIGVSLGVAAALNDTIERADTALYSAKALGRNRVAFA